MSYFWPLFWGGCGVLLVAAGWRVRIHSRWRGSEPTTSLRDDDVRRILDEGVFDPGEEEPLDLDSISEEERLFWEESWDEPEPW